MNEQLITEYWITNLLLESGYAFEGEEIVSTLTEKCHVRINAGKFAEIITAETPFHSELPCYDANAQLLLPAFREMHIHLDKTYYGGPWRAVRPAPNGVFSRIEEEKALLSTLLPTAKDRAEQLLELVLNNGSTHVRTHCNIEPTTGLRNLEATLQALESYQNKCTYEIVAFPQHGLLHSVSVPLVREALRSGAHLVGGLDPATVDGNIEASLDAMVQLAVDANADIDMHLHDAGHLGIFTMRRLAALTREIGWQGRVTISHGFGLAGVPASLVSEIADLFAELGITLATTVPIGTMTMPLPLLYERGAKVVIGQDSITDHWSPFGTGDNLERASIFAECYGWRSERKLAEALGFITDGLLPLDRNGTRVWPAVGDEASCVLVAASCTAEAVARRAPRKAVIHKGSVVSGEIAPSEDS
ncbi:Cytosine/adenosine deaminase [Paenibacillus uliginis N3/975]|uniref:Cytosine/adenosine deaminase n=1 Tax=Paenibacillus uliginis N3/975 TaxID=1313296 RepID=A0A1X7HTA0_9BACL|nr:amidohydrolase family protein [Paenibacillus uliginis]SMF92592.1 Cytosine/adenosine deaminase [Paenibacillus uliginis N3/975]